MPFLTYFFTSEIADIFHKFMFGIGIVSLRVSVYPTSVEIGILHSQLKQFSLCSTVIGMTLVSPVTLYSPSMIGSCAFIILGLYAVSNFYALVVRGHMLTYPCQSHSWGTKALMNWCSHSSLNFLPHQGLRAHEVGLLGMRYEFSPLVWLPIYLALIPLH